MPQTAYKENNKLVYVLPRLATAVAAQRNVPVSYTHLLFRHNFMSGTHTLSVALFGVLRPGDRMVAVTGRPYDTCLLYTSRCV